MKHLNGIHLNSLVYFILAGLLVTQTFVMWDHLQLQKEQAIQLASLNQKILSLKKHQTTEPQPANIGTNEISEDIRLLVNRELQPLIASQNDLLNSLARAQSVQQHTVATTITETFDLDEDINAFEESSSIITQSISNNHIDIESASRLHDLSQFLSDDSKRELRDRIVNAINNQQLMVSSNFIPPF